MSEDRLNRPTLTRLANKNYSDFKWPFDELPPTEVMAQLAQRLLAEREAAATAKQFYAQQVEKYAAEVPKAMERVFEVMCVECYWRVINGERCEHSQSACGLATFTTCPLDGIKAIREELEG